MSRPNRAGAIALIVFVVLMAVFLIALLAGSAKATPTHKTGDPLADTRPCVANREANSLDTRLPRAELEARWEVTGKGTPYVVPVFGRVVAYPWCDHGPLDKAFIGVVYHRNDAGQQIAVAVVWYKAAKTSAGKYRRQHPKG